MVRLPLADSREVARALDEPRVRELLASVPGATEAAEVLVRCAAETAAQIGVEGAEVDVYVREMYDDYEDEERDEVLVELRLPDHADDLWSKAWRVLGAKAGEYLNSMTPDERVELLDILGYAVREHDSVLGRPA